MRIIEILSDKIEDELTDACDYIELAIEYKIECPEAAELFYKLSRDEMTHMDMLHKRVVETIMAYKRDVGAPPAAMEAVYNHLHKRFVAKAEKVTNLQNIYKK